MGLEDVDRYDLTHVVLRGRGVEVWEIGDRAGVSDASLEMVLHILSGRHKGVVEPDFPLSLTVRERYLRGVVIEPLVELAVELLRVHPGGGPAVRWSSGN